MVGHKKKTPKKKKAKQTGHANTRTTEVTWDAVGETKTPTCTSGMILTVLGILLVILMVNLYLFVDDPAAAMRAQQQQNEPRPKPEAKNFTRAPKRPTYEITEEVDMQMLQQLIQELDDRILVVAFEQANPENKRKKLWRRWERIARALPQKKQFKRMDEDDLPKIVRFDCNEEQQPACEQLVGKQNLPAAVFWKSNIPRFFPEDVSTDTHVFNYLAKQMSEAIQYLETQDDADYFVSDSEGINLLFLGRDESKAYHQVADIMRDMANFARTADATIAETYEAEVPSLRMYRPFDESPLLFQGNLSDSNSIASFVRENSVPLFGEWTQNTVKMYQSRKLPVVFIAVDPTEDESEGILELGKNLATEFWGRFSFTHLDGIMNADLANRLGVQELPEVFILVSGHEVRKKIDLDAPEESIRSTIAEWETVSQGGGEQELLDGDEYDEYDIDYDEEYDEEELTDLDNESEDDGAEEEEDEKEEL